MAITITAGYNWANGATAMPTRLNLSQTGLTINCAADSLLGRGSGAGAIQEISCTTAGRSMIGAANAAAQRVLLGHDSTATVTSASTIALDLSAPEDLKTLALAHGTTFSTTNRATGRSYALRIVCDGTTRSLAFPAGWVFDTDKPTQIAANKTGTLVLRCYGPAETDIVASYAVQS